MQRGKPKPLIRHAVVNKPNRLILDIVSIVAFWPAPSKCGTLYQTIQTVNPCRLSSIAELLF